MAHVSEAAFTSVIPTLLPETVAPLSGAVICSNPGVGVAEGLAPIVAVGVAAGVALVVAPAVGVDDGLMNCASTLRVICCAAALTREGLVLHGLTLLRPNDH